MFEKWALAQTRMQKDKSKKLHKKEQKKKKKSKKHLLNSCLCKMKKRLRIRNISIITNVDKMGDQA